MSEYPRDEMITVDTAETFVRDRPPTFQEALDHAYDEAKKRTGQLNFRIEEIIVVGTNPVTDYRVVLSPSG